MSRSETQAGHQTLCASKVRERDILRLGQPALGDTVMCYGSDFAFLVCQSSGCYRMFAWLHGFILSCLQMSGSQRPSHSSM